MAVNEQFDNLKRKGLVACVWMGPGILIESFKFAALWRNLLVREVG